MAVNWEPESEHLGVVRVSGKLGIAELSDVQGKMAGPITQSGAYRILVVLDAFDGWTAEKGWEDASFADAYDEHIDKMGFVGEERWRDLMFAFTLKGMRPVEIEYFLPEEEQQARAWLAE